MITSLGVTAVKLVSYGFFIGLGFYLSKKLTNIVDEKLLYYDQAKLKKIAEELIGSNNDQMHNISV